MGDGTVKEEDSPKRKKLRPGDEGYNPLGTDVGDDTANRDTDFDQFGNRRVGYKTKEERKGEIRTARSAVGIPEPPTRDMEAERARIIADRIRAAAFTGIGRSATFGTAGGARGVTGRTPIKKKTLIGG